MRGLVVLIGAFLCVGLRPANAATYHVNPDGSGDYSTIAEAVAAARSGDRILLGSGTFRGPGNRDVDFNGKSLTIAAQSGDPALCRIDCEATPGAPHRAFLCITGEGPGAALEDLTIESGCAGVNLPEHTGGAILMSGAAPTLRHCVFRGNRAFLGGAIFCDGSTPTIADCVFEENAATVGGGAIALDNNSLPLIEGCTFTGNVADDGGGISCTWSSAMIFACTFVRNRAWLGCALSAFAASSPNLERCILAFGTVGRAVVCEDANVYLTCCDVFGNEGGDWVGCLSGQFGSHGNISIDPLFCDLELGDYRLQQNSPCAPFSPENPECDLLGAWPVGCQATPIVRTSWGAVKALFRE